MGKRFVSNDSDHAILVGGVLIPAHDGREVDETLLPADGDSQAGSEPTEGGDGPPRNDEEALAELLKGSVKAISSELAALSDAGLATLERLEQEGEKPRSTLLAHITEERLQRAQTKTGAPE